MVRIGYHASHEQFAPSDLLRWTAYAQEAGFGAVLSSDHVSPWSARQGSSGFAWSWLGAAMQATYVPFGVVTAPVGWRYHPVVIAQAAMTLAEMFPGRFRLAVGSGENLNEHVVAQRWPSKEERNARLAGAVGILRALFAGARVSQPGPIPTDRARIHVRAPAPPILGAALSEETARFVGTWADGLITINLPPDSLARVVRAFRDGGGEGKPLFVQVHVSWAPTEEEARANAMDQWGTNTFPSPISENLATPEEFDALLLHVREEDIRRSVHVSADLEVHAEYLQGFVDLGFSEIHIHNVGRNQDAFLDAFGRHVLPRFSRGWAKPPLGPGATK